MNSELTHIPVLLPEVVSELSAGNNNDGAFLVYDGTLGGASHAKALLETNPNVFVLGVDRDASVIQKATEKLSEFQERVHLIHGVFSTISEHLDSVSGEWPSISNESSNSSLCDAMLVDLGVSSFQLDEAARGFSFKNSAPLDMRMDNTQTLSAEQVVNEYQPGELKRVLLRGGVGATSGQLARAIVNNRPVETTTELAEICKKALPPHVTQKNRNPATVVFQAIRIEVNDEFGEIERFLDEVPNCLAPGGTLAVISFHSSEDKLVASRMRSWTRAEKPLKDLPQADKPALGKLLTGSAIVPSEAEIANNPRSRSARLRVFRKNLEIKG